MNNEFDDVISESSHISISSDGSTPVSLRYMYCASSDAVDNAERHFRSVLSNAQGGIIQVFLDCEGRDLGRHGGKLGLVQLGIEEEAYVIDVIEFPGSLMHLKGILEHPQVQKVVWDGRSDYSELWHGHRIRMRPVLDLQLVDVYRYSPERVNRRCSIRLSGLGKAFDKVCESSKSSTVDVSLRKRSSIIMCFANNKFKTVSRQGTYATIQISGSSVL